MKRTIAPLWILPFAQFVSAAPTIDTQPAAIYSDPGSPVIFTVAATAGSGALSYVWSLDDVPLTDNEFISGASANRLVISPAQMSDAGAYKVVVTDDAGSTPSQEAALVLDLPLPVISVQPADVTIASGSPATFSVTASDADTYQWYLGDSPISDGGVYSGTTTATLNFTTATQANNGVYSVRVTNDRGAVASRAARLTVTLNTSLGDALDTNTVAIANPGGWFAQSTYASDGVDAVRSADISSNESTEVNCTVHGPGNLSFQYWADSEAPDKLWFYFDTADQSSISGTGTSWKQISRFVHQGDHLARWVYWKDGSVIQGLDAGFVDQFSFVPFVLSSVEEAVDGVFPLPLVQGGSGRGWYGQGTDTHDGLDAARAPVISHNESAWFETTVMGPGEIVFWAKASSEGPDYLRLRVDGYDVYALSGDQDWREVRRWIGWGEHTLRWSYEKDGSVAQHQDTVWVDEISYTPVDFSSLAEAADDPFMQWETSESNPWFGQSRFTDDGVDALQSGVTGHNGESWIKATVEGPGTLSFRWKTNSEGPDYLRFLLDGVEKIRKSGDNDWSDYSVAIEDSGTRELMWKYTKDGSVWVGEDAGWVDQVTFTPQRDPVTLTVEPSAYGSPSPAPGDHVYDWGGEVVLSVADVTSGLTRHACTGWTGTGSVPSSGSTGAVTIPSIEEDSSIAWNWETQHWLEVSIIGNGTLSHADDFCPEASTQNLVATPATGWLFMGWADDASGTDPNVSLVMDAPKAVTAVFSDDADEDGLTNLEEEAIGSNPRLPDTDGDGFGDKLEVDNGGSPTVSDAWRVDHIRNNGEEFDLYASDVVLDVRFGQLLLDIEGGNAVLKLQLEESGDLGDWTPLGVPLEWTVPVDENMKFLRVTPQGS